MAKTLIVAIAAASTLLLPASASVVSNSTLAARPYAVSTAAPRDAQFQPVARPDASARCESTADPVALATPNPLLEQSDLSNRVIVSFIIGTDGRVHSPLVLESAGGNRDADVINAIQNWRFRPATCNGAPTEIEAKIEFSQR